MNPIRYAYGLVLKLTEAFLPVADPVLERNIAALTAAEERDEVWDGKTPFDPKWRMYGPGSYTLPTADFPACTCPARQAADLDDHWLACKARAGDTSPAGECVPPTPPAGRALYPNRAVAEFQNLLSSSESRPVPTLGEVHLVQLKPCNQNWQLPCEELPSVRAILKQPETADHGAVYDLEVRVRSTYCPHVTL